MTRAGPESGRRIAQLRIADAERPNQPRSLLAEIRRTEPSARVLTPGALGMASVDSVGPGRQARVALRASKTLLDAELDPAVDVELIELAMAQKELVVVERDSNGVLWVRGMLRPLVPKDVRITGENLVFDAPKGIRLRAGEAELRITEGTVEVVAKTVSFVCRGVLRLVGRALRLN